MLDPNKRSRVRNKMLQIFKINPMSNQSINFERLIGSKASLYYNNLSNQFQLGSVIFEVIENEDDGYRSSMQEVRILSTDAARKDREYLGGVIIRDGDAGDFRGYEIVDENTGHVWLRFGTDHHDDYYPCFSFNFTPKPTIEESEQKIKELIK